MGTHPSGPSLVAGGEGLTLKDWISQHLSALGDARHLFGPDLPFLFKACPALPFLLHAPLLP
jgi:mannose-6-phosphate isomerase class I